MLEEGGGPDIGRRAYLAALGAGLAGCSTDGGRNDTPVETDTPTDTSTDTPNDTATDTPEETETSEPETVYEEGIPIRGFDLYEQRLENSDTSTLPPNRDWEYIAEGLEGQDPMTAAERFANLVTQEQFMDGGETSPEQINPDNVYKLAREMYKAKAKGANIPDLMINVDYLRSTASQPMVAVSPVENGNPQTPLLATPFGMSPPGEEETAMGQVRLEDGDAALNMVPYNIQDVRTLTEVRRDGDGGAREFRGSAQEYMSWGMHGVEKEADIMFVDNAYFEAMHRDRDPGIVTEFNQEVGQYVGNGEITGAAYDEEAGEWAFKDLPDFEYGDEFPEPETITQ